MTTRTEPFIIAFGQLDWLDPDNRRHHVAGLELFENLISRGVWYSSRTLALPEETEALFYLKKTGVIARATLKRVMPLQETDETLLAHYGADKLFRTRLDIANVRRFDPPVQLKSLIQDLNFISNKGSYWGTSLMSTPRRIPKVDFDRIVSAALCEKQLRRRRRGDDDK